jgi:hypothetical protein
MPPGDEYRRKAVELADRAAREIDPAFRHEYDQLTLFYIRLADQAERNARTDVVYETPPQPAQQQQQQQQQQPTPERDRE